MQEPSEHPRDYGRLLGTVQQRPRSPSDRHSGRLLAGSNAVNARETLSQVPRGIVYQEVCKQRENRYCFRVFSCVTRSSRSGSVEGKAASQERRKSNGALTCHAQACHQQSFSYRKTYSEEMVEPEGRAKRWGPAGFFPMRDPEGLCRVQEQGKRAGGA